MIKIECSGEKTQRLFLFIVVVAYKLGIQVILFSGKMKISFLDSNPWPSMMLIYSKRAIHKEVLHVFEAR